MKGILKNAKIDAEYRHEDVNTLHAGSELDREEVIKNTQLNSRMAGSARIESTSGTSNVPSKEKSKSTDPLMWDERNLLVNEQEKSATMKIDEPKTPYLGGFNVNNDYYRKDNEDELENIEAGGDDSFDLGEGIDDEYDDEEQIGDNNKFGSDNTIENTRSAQISDDAPPDSSKDEKHQLFEQKRKQHYHLKGLPLKQQLAAAKAALENEDENEDEDEEDEEDEE